jgi:hypothetical protein
MIIISTRWPEDQQFACPNNANLKIQPVQGEGGDGKLSQTVDANSNVSGLQWEWTCPCGEEHIATITKSDLAALNIPTSLQSPIVAATIAGTVYAQ